MDFPKASLLLYGLLHTVLVTRAENQISTQYSRNAAIDCNMFNNALYEEVKDDHDNMCLSSLSLHSALSMLRQGAAGKTKNDLTIALFLQENLDNYRYLYNALMHEDNDVTVRVENSLSAASDIQLNPKFVSNIKNIFRGSVYSVDFSRPEDATRIINERVSNSTNNKIKQLIPPGVLDSDTRLVLTNAFYFRGFWKQKFDKSATDYLPFSSLDGADYLIPFMYVVGDFNYARINVLNTTALEFPYKGNRDISLFVFLPDSVIDPRHQACATVNVFLLPWKQEKVEVFLPKFKIESEFDMKPHLSKMGLGEMFTSSADFSEINESERLQVSSVIQKAVIEVDEEGTEAAAASSVAISNRLGSATTKIFFAKMPFCFSLVDKDLGLVLFNGNFINPRPFTIK